MKCEACGAEVADNAVYCHKCGERLKMLHEDPSSEKTEASTESTEPQRPEGAVDRFKEAAGRRQGEDGQEQELWAGRYSAKEMLGTWLISGLASIGLLVVAIWLTLATSVSGKYVWLGLIVLLLAWWGYLGFVVLYRKASVRYRLTSQRFFHERGILRYVTDRVEVIDMDDIATEQTLLQRMVGVGTLRISSSDLSHPVLEIRGVENVKEVGTKMDDARREERMRRGLHIESV